MKLPMSWLNDYMDASDINPIDYAHIMTMTGSKVEEIQNMGASIQKVVTGKIIEIKPHEDSDHLVVCQIDVKGDKILQIVTGASNVREGQIVPVALSGSTLPGDVHIKKGKLRGVVSEGMLCSHEELGISVEDLGYEPEYGILILPEDTEVGIDIKDVFGLNEDVVEFEITSNRPDCFSVIGLARETAISFNKEFKLHKPQIHENNEKIDEYLKVSVLNDKKCLRYSAKMVKNVKIGPSPEWMVHRLKASGIRSINNIVDITNYVLLEYGQPMHAFDERDLVGNQIIVRTANDGEVIKTLDEQDRVLNENDLVICDAKRPVAIAGVMGGFNSEVKDDTTTVIFESATFDGASVRLTAQKVGLRTEASSRYEKGLDVYNTIPAVERACELVEMLGCGEVVGGTIDIFPTEKKMVELKLVPEKVNTFLGTNVSREQMLEILKKLEFIVNEDEMLISPPTFRPDIEGFADVAEEIARFYGYEKIPTTLLSGEATRGLKTEKQLNQDKIKNIMISQGFCETCTYTFVSPTVFDKLNLSKEDSLRNTIVITNPLGEDTSVMRTSLIGSTLEVLSRNYNRRVSDVRIFEIGKIFIPVEDSLPDEREIISVGMYGNNADFYDIKGAAEALLSGMNVCDVTYEACGDNPTFHPGRCAVVKANGEQIGIIGQIHPDVCENFGIETEAFVCSIDYKLMSDSFKSEIKYKHLPKFPAVTRDIAMLADKDIPVAEIEHIIKKNGGKILEEVKLFDVYEGKQIPLGKKSVAYSVSFRAEDRSLTNDEVNVVFDKILKSMEKELNVLLR